MLVIDFHAAVPTEGNNGADQHEAAGDLQVCSWNILPVPCDTIAVSERFYEGLRWLPGESITGDATLVLCLVPFPSH